MKLPYELCKKVNCWYCGELFDCEIWYKKNNTLHKYNVTTA